MQKLFENWRKFRNKENDTLKEGFAASARKDTNWQRIAAQDPDKALQIRREEKRRATEVLQAALKETGVVLAMLVDPTGVTGYPELYRASKLVSKQPTLLHAGNWFLALLGALPAIGGARVIGKTSRATKIINNAEKVAKVLRGGGREGIELADRVDAAAKAARSNMKRELNQWVGGIYHWSQAQANTLLRVASSIDGGIWKKAAYRGEALRSLDELAKRVGYSTNKLSEAIRNSRALDYVKDHVPPGEVYDPVQREFVRSLGLKTFDRRKWKYVQLKNTQLAPRGRRTERPGDGNWPVDMDGRVSGGEGVESVHQMGELDWVTADFTNVGQSFSKDIFVARSFMGGKPGHKIKVVYRTSLDNDKLIDVGKVSPKTRRMGENEVMGLGKVRIDGFWIERSAETRHLWN